MKSVTLLALMVLSMGALGQTKVFINGSESSLTPTEIHLVSTLVCDSGIYYWSESDPHFRGKLDDYCIDGSSGEGISYDVCNGLGAYVAVTNWNASGKTCYTEETVDDYCDGFSPQPPGCEGRGPYD